MNTKQLTQSVLRNRKYQGKEWIDWELYDSLLTVVSSEQTLTFFQNTVGSVGRTRTNMKQAGQLPSPWVFLVTHAQFEIYNLSGEQLQTAAHINPVGVIAGKGHFDITVDPNIMYEGSLASIYNMNTEQTMTDSGADTTAIGNFYFKTIRFKFPLFIDSNCSFNLKTTITTPAAGSGYTAADTLLKWRFTGLLSRNK